ncbi:spermidine synthase [Planctomycetota bacterium]|nr:spermidine synthase [Planctomycetota bacterium]
MTTANSIAPAKDRTAFAPALLLLFAGSGCAALIYEVVWFHLLRFVIGGSSISLGLLLGSFMGGMCLGNVLLPRWLPKGMHPLRVYALLELGIALYAIILPMLLPWLGSIYVQSQGRGQSDLLLRGTVCAIALLPPTILMGATLPAIARWVGSSRQGLAALGWFYGSNIIGGVAGTLLAGFWLLRVHDTIVATYVAAAINIAIAALALLLAALRPFVANHSASGANAEGINAKDPAPPHARRLVLLAIALSGATALGAEVAWTRLLSLLFGASVYTFALILAVFLIGLGIGSARGSQIAARTNSPTRAFLLCQLLLMPALLYSAWMMLFVIPWAEPTYIFQERIAQNVFLRFPWDFARCALAILPAPLLWGASFPLALAAAFRGHHDAGRLVGSVAAANTLGAIIGALATSLAAIGNLGSQGTQQILALLAGGTAALLTLALPLRHSRARKLATCCVIAAASCGFALLIAPVPNGLIAWGRFVDSWDSSKYLYVAEGQNSSVAITKTGDFLNFHVAGKVEASTDPTDMRLQRLLGHLPALSHGNPRSVLIVGCGAGVTAGSFCDYDSVQRIVICEMEPRVLDCARNFMADQNGGVLDDPRTEIVFDDARHFMLTTRERFDIITSDPIHPWVRGAAALYTSEYYELVKQHLNPSGVVTQWVPLYETDEASVKSQLGTFFSAFPNGTMWNSAAAGTGYDVAVLGTALPTHLDLESVELLLDKNANARTHLATIGLDSAPRLFSTYCGSASDLAPWLADAEPNRDIALRLQYLAGLAFDRHDEQKIFVAMQKFCSWPEGMFVGSALQIAELRLLLKQ